MAEARGLVQLAADLANAKHLEGEAKAARVLCEDAIIRISGFEKTEGQETYEEDFVGGRCRVVLKQPVSTSVDAEAWLALRRTLPPKHPGRAIFNAKYSLDTKLARELQAVDKKAWAEVSSVITRKPGKVAVEVKELVVQPLAIDSTKRLGVLGPLPSGGELDE